MSFMQKQVIYDRWFEVDTSQGIWFLPQDLIGKTTKPKHSELRDYLPPGAKIYSTELRDGYGARLSAPGYLDRTEWAVFETKDEAEQYLAETYEDEEDEA